MDDQLSRNETRGVNAPDATTTSNTVLVAPPPDAWPSLRTKALAAIAAVVASLTTTFLVVSRYYGVSPLGFEAVIRHPAVAAVLAGWHRFRRETLLAAALALSAWLTTVLSSSNRIRSVAPPRTAEQAAAALPPRPPSPSTVAPRDDASVESQPPPRRRSSPVLRRRTALENCSPSTNISKSTTAVKEGPQEGADNHRRRVSFRTELNAHW